MNELSSSVSSLSLDNLSHQTITHTKKKRPARAFHNIASNSIASNLNGQFPSNSSLAEVPSFVTSPIAQAIASPIDSSVTTENIPLATNRLTQQAEYLTKSYEQTTQGVGRQLYNISPSPITLHYAMDAGVSDTRLINMSTRMIPSDEYVRDGTKIPLGLTVQPFANCLPKNGIPTLPDSYLLRCNRCRAYNNPFFKYNHDSTVSCNLCGVKTNVSDQTDPLRHGTVDFIAPPQYNLTPHDPLPLHYIFLLDLSLTSKDGKAVYAFIEACRNAINVIAEEQKKCRIAIMGYDKYIRFYKLSAAQDKLSEVLITDITDPYLPLSKDFFVDPNESMEIIQLTLDKLFDMLDKTELGILTDNCYGSALNFAKFAMESLTMNQGGKIISFVNSKPNCGNGNLSIVRDNNLKNSLICENDFYKKLGNGLLNSFISVDTYVLNARFIDMVSISYPSLVTQGKFHYHPSFGNDDFKTVISEMVHDVRSMTGYQCLLKVRTSNGISVSKYYTNDASSADPRIAALSKDTNLDIALKYDDKLKPGTNVFIQASLLYTDIHGVRKIRSLNTNSTVATAIGDIFKNCNQHIVLNLILKDAIYSQIKKWAVAKVRERVDEPLTNMLTQFFGLVSGHSGESSINTLPKCISSLPDYILSFVKTELLKVPVQSTRGNDRIYDLINFLTLPSNQLLFKLCPQIIPLHVPMENDDLTVFDADGTLLNIVPDCVDNLSVSNGQVFFTDGGCYLINVGERIYLWLNERTNSMLIQDLLGTNLPPNQLVLEQCTLPELDTEINQKARNMIRHWCNVMSKDFIPVSLLRPGIDRYYSQIMPHILYEDSNMQRIESKETYVRNVKDKVKNKIMKKDYVKAGTSLSNAHEHMHQNYVQF